MATGKLQYCRGFFQVLNEISGPRTLPTEGSILTAIDLRRYADSIGDIPSFLQSVEVPVKQEPHEEQVLNDNQAL